MYRWLGDPAQDRERFVADSPITYIRPDDTADVGHSGRE